MSPEEKEQLLLALEGSSLFQEASPALQQVYRTLLPELYEALGELRNEKVSMATLLQASVAVLEFLIEKDFLGTMRLVAPEKVPAKLMDEDVSEKLARSLEYAKFIATEFPSIMEEEGLTEEELFREMEYSPALINRITSGEITIGELIMLNPELALQNAA